MSSKKIESVVARLDLIDELLKCRAVPKQQLRQLYGSTQRLLDQEIDAIAIGNSDELRAQRKRCAARANEAIDLIEVLEAEGIDGDVVDRIVGGIAWRRADQRLHLALVMCHEVFPAVRLSLDVPKSDLQAFSSKIALEGVASIEEELNRLCTNSLRSYNANGLIGVQSFKRAMASTLDLPIASLLPSQHAANGTFVFQHSHHVMSQNVLPDAQETCGGKNGDSSHHMHLLLSYEAKESMWISVVRQTGGAGTGEVVYGACHRFDKGVSDDFNIRKALIGCITCMNDASGTNWIAADGLNGLSVWVEILSEDGNINEKRGKWLAAKAEELFYSDLYDIDTRHFGEVNGKPDSEAFACARSLIAMSDSGSESARGDVSRCTIGILSNPDADSPMTKGTLIPFIAPHHALGVPITKVLKLCYLAPGPGESGGVTITVGINFNTELELVDLAAGDNLDAMYNIVVSLPTPPPVSTPNSAEQHYMVAMKLEYSHRRTIHFNYAAVSATGVYSGEKEERDGSEEWWQWLDNPLVIDGDTDQRTPLMTMAKSSTSEIDVDVSTTRGVTSVEEQEQSGEGTPATAPAPAPAPAGVEGNGKGQWSCAGEAAELKTKGNTLLQSGETKDFIAAHYMYSLAIAHEPQNAVLWSNRSAAALHVASAAKAPSYLKSALTDAQRCVSIRPDWAKGHIREGDAHFRLSAFDLAVTSYKRALDIDHTSSGINDKLVTSLEKKEAQERAREEREAGALKSRKDKLNDGSAASHNKPSNCSCM